jgi:hypothetical protein
MTIGQSEETEKLTDKMMDRETDDIMIQRTQLRTNLHPSEKEKWRERLFIENNSNSLEKEREQGRMRQIDRTSESVHKQ